MIKKKVFGGVPYVIIEPSETWNSEYYSILFDEEGFYSWYDNYIADNTAIYKICDVLTVQNGEENGFYIDIRVLKPQPSPGPLAAVTGTGVSTDPLDLIDIKCVFATNEESILSYALHLWETTKHVIYTTPPERYPIREGSGYNSAIMGHYRNQADGDYSVAEGLDANASGESSHAEGCDTEASGLGSHAEGYDTRAIGDYSHTEGSGTTANNDYEHAEGIYNKSNTGKTDDLKTRHSIGIGNVRFDTVGVDRKNAHEIMANGDHYVYGLGGYDGTNAIEGTSKTLQEVINGKQDTLVSGTSIKTINGESLLGSGDIEITVTPDLSDYQTKSDDTLNTTNKTVVGAINEILSKATGVGKIDPNSDGTGEIFNAYSGKYLNSATAQFSHAEGYGTQANGDQAHAEGYRTTAEGGDSHAEGRYTKAVGIYSHAEGYRTIAEGGYAHAEGSNTNATGDYSHVEGTGAKSEGNYSHAEGRYTNALNPSEHAEGSFNVSSTGDTEDLQTRHSVGIGTSSSSRKNAHEIMANGDHYIYGLGGYDGTNATAETSQTLQAVINSLSTITVDYNQPTTSYTGSDSTTIYKIFDLSSLKYTEGNDIILINGAQRLKYQYAYGETQAATVQVNESTSIEYNLINILSPLITNIFSLEELTIVHGKINAETEEKYYLIINNN